MDNIKIIIAVLIVVLLGGGAYYGFTVWQDSQIAQQKEEAKAKSDKEAQAQKQAEQDAITARTKCTDAGNYYVLTLDHDNSNVGQDILVKQKADGQVCSYTVVDGDFEVKNADAQYFKAIGANTMITDVGTGPTGRMLRLYDLTEKKLITEKKYFGDLTISTSTLTYFGEAKTAIKNCKGDSTVEKIVDLKTLLIKEGKTTRCVAAQ